MSNSKKRSPWPIGIALGLFLVVLVNGVMIAIAGRNAPVMESEQYYAESLDYETVLEKHRASAALGFTAALKVEAERIVWTVTDRDGQPVAHLEGTLAFRRADTKKYDRNEPVSETQPGVYSAPRGDAQGMTNLRLELTGREAPFLAEQSLFLP